MTYRPARWPEDAESVMDVQVAVWSAEVATPTNHLVAAEDCGALVVVAEADGRCIGFSYAFPAWDGSEAWLHSHQTALVDDRQGRGVGAHLKWIQRAAARAAGHRRITWTFDPLVARNAHFNLNKLGVAVEGYKIDQYGPMRDSQNDGLPTDRLWAVWHLEAPQVGRLAASHRLATGIDIPVVAAGEEDGDEVGIGDAGGDAGGVGPADAATLLTAEEAADGDVSLPGSVNEGALAAGEVRIATPADLAAVREHLGAEGLLTWRRRQRDAFVSALGAGYDVVGFEPAEDARIAWYLLRRARTPQE